MKKLSLKRVFANVILALLIGLFVSSILGETAGLIVGVSTFAFGTGLQLVFGGFLGKNALAMAVQTEVWVQDIQETLFYENEFLFLAVDHTQYIKNKTVHVPQAGGKPAVVKNRADLEATLTQRTDTELTYDLDNYTTDPVVVKDVEDLQVSYEKRTSVMGQHIATLGDTIATSTLYAWAVNASTTHVLRTSGADTAMLPNATATGKRLAFTQKDLARAAAIMDVDKVPKKDRFTVIPTCMITDLMTDTELIKLRALVGEDMLKMGVIAQLHGFNIISRGEAVVYTNAGANNLRAIGAAAAATDCAGAICWSKWAVSQAMGEIQVYINLGVAKSYGDIISAEVNHGTSNLRPANWGRVSIAQGYVAP